MRENERKNRDSREHNRKEYNRKEYNRREVLYTPEEQRRLKKQLRHRKRRRQVILVRTIVGLVAAALAVLLGVGMFQLGSYIWKKTGKGKAADAVRLEEAKLISHNNSVKPEITENFLTPNEYSRPGEALPEVTEIFVHYTANPGTTAAQNRSYFENLGKTGETSASTHFVIGYEGEIVQCLPLNEIGYAVKEHNYNSVSIECCYLDENGKFTEETCQSLLRLLGWLMKEYDLGPSAVKRHYDANGKLCPLYYAEHEDAWEQLLKDLKDYIG